MIHQISKYFRYSIILLILCFNIIKSAEKWDGYWGFEKSNPKKKSEYKIPGLLESSGQVWIKIYQKGISSQDLPSCVFHPSCSRFASSAINRYGFAKGWLLAGDRLLRCNPFAVHYEYPIQHHKLFDPVTKYEFK